jgi:hypothetical protein
MMAADRDQAQLWSIYFAIEAIAEPPEFLYRAKDQLRECLGASAPNSARAPGPLAAVSDTAPRRSQQPSVSEFKFRHETLLGKVVTGARPQDAIERFLGDPSTDVITLEDLPRCSREQIAAIEGVGEMTMRQLDDALAERGLAWSNRRTMRVV